MLSKLFLLAGGITAISALLWLRRDRHYESSDSVAAAYDAWTEDRLLERLWGEHVHLGHYGKPPGPRDFRAAKKAFVHELGIGVAWINSSWIKARWCRNRWQRTHPGRDYGLDVLGISVSQPRSARYRATPAKPCRWR